MSASPASLEVKDLQVGATLPAALHRELWGLALLT